MKLKSKRYNTAREQVDSLERFELADAVAKLAQFPKAKFDETVELSIHLGVDPRQSSQMVRGIVNLPKGSGKKVRVIAFTESPELALEAGAEEAGMDELMNKIQGGWLDFDIAVATPSAMKEVRKLARVLGPRGLMPNPKSGTVSEDVAAAIKDIKLGGRVEFKMDKTANIGVIVGKRSHSEADLVENIHAVIDAIAKARPENLKGKYVCSMAVSATMSPSVKLVSTLYNF